jgi:hypothetical protein
MMNIIKNTFEIVDGCIVRKDGLPVKFFVGKSGHLHISVKRKTLYVHRIMWTIYHGDIPDKTEIDHINGDPSDNRIENLRLATRCENNQNTKRRLDNTSGTKGVFWDGHSKSWRVSIWANKKKHDFGRFLNLSDASLAANIARRKIHGVFANIGNNLETV